MKINITNPKVWGKLAEKNLPISHKIKIYEKLGGAYKLTDDTSGGQVFNKLVELLKFKKNGPTLGESDKSTNKK
jgi:hypothetical protein